MTAPAELTLFQQLLKLPNLLSALRLLLAPVFLALIIADRAGWALAVLALASATDWFDGYFARKLNLITRMGQLLDPAADRLYILATLIGLLVTERLPLWLVLVVVARDLMLLAVYPVLATHGYGPLPVHYLGKAGTFCLLYAFPLLLLAEVWGSAQNVILPIAWAFALWGVGLYWWAGFVYLRQVKNVVLATRTSGLK